MRVQILLSTYNGATYFKPLMESLLAQDCPDIAILVRDDGSWDTTPKLLLNYAAHYPHVNVVLGEHSGFVNSFFRLLDIASSTAEYLALCDQDDIWLEDKLSRAVCLLSRCSPQKPALYCSRLAIVDEDLKPLRYSDIPRRRLSFRNALVENQAAGCTILLNQAARRLLRCVPSVCVSHDWWIYLVVSAFGTVVYDEEPRILYRRHGGNVFGAPNGTINMWKIKIRQFLLDGKCKRIVQQACEFRRIYGALLPHEHRNVIERFLERRKQFVSRLCYALFCEVYRQSLRDHYLLKARIAFDRL